ELEIQVTTAGLTPMQALVAGTRTSARILGLDQLGTVAAGKSADFLVLNGNPLDNIANTRRIDKVYLRGQEFNRAAMRARQAELVGAGRHLGRQQDRGPEQGRRQEGDAVRFLAIESMLLLELEERRPEGIAAPGVPGIGAPALRQDDVFETELQAAQRIGAGD